MQRIEATQQLADNTRHGDTLGFARPAEAAHFMGISKAMVHKLITEGKMPARRYGRVVRVPWSWLRAEAHTQ